MDGSSLPTICGWRAPSRAAATIVAAGERHLASCEDLRGLLAQEDFATVEAGAGIVSDLLVIRLLSGDAQALRRALVTLLVQVTGRWGTHPTEKG